MDFSSDFHTLIFFSATIVLFDNLWIWQTTIIRKRRTRRNYEGSQEGKIFPTVSKDCSFTYFPNNINVNNPNTTLNNKTLYKVDLTILTHLISTDQRFFN